MPATLATVDLETGFRRGKYVTEAIGLMANAAREAMSAEWDAPKIRDHVGALRGEIAAEIAAGEPRRPGETDYAAYARVLPVVEEAVDAAFSMLFPTAGV